MFEEWLKNEQFYLLRPEFVNDLKGRLYNRVAKSLAFQFCTARSQLKWTREGAAWIWLYPCPLAAWHAARAAARRSVYATISAVSDAVSNAE
jgi:hypothetical protein